MMKVEEDLSMTKAMIMPLEKNVDVLSQDLNRTLQAKEPNPPTLTISPT